MRPSGQHRFVVTGAGRGLGLEFARQLAVRGGLRGGACRSLDSAGDLRAALGAQGMVVELDVTDARSVSAAATAVGRDLDAIDLLINAAGPALVTRLRGVAGAQRRLSAQESVAGMLRVIEGLGPGDSGAILGHDGTDLLAHGAERA